MKTTLKLTGAILMVVGIVLMMIGSASSSAIQTQSSSSVRYEFSNELTAENVSQAVGIPSDRVQSVNRGPDGCTVDFALPLRVDRNQTFDREGNLISEEVVEVNELEEWQAELLQDFMVKAGCGRFQRKGVGS